MSLQPHEHIKTLRVRLKNKHAKLLSRQAREVNQVWNYCNDLAAKVFNREHKFLSAYDLAPYTAGATKEGLLSLHSQTVQAINEEYIKSRKAAKQIKLHTSAMSALNRLLKMNIKESTSPLTMRLGASSALNCSINALTQAVGTVKRMKVSQPRNAHVVMS